MMNKQGNKTAVFVLCSHRIQPQYLAPIFTHPLSTQTPFQLPLQRCIISCPLFHLQRGSFEHSEAAEASHLCKHDFAAVLTVLVAEEDSGGRLRKKPAPSLSLSVLVQSLSWQTDRVYI